MSAREFHNKLNKSLRRITNAGRSKIVPLFIALIILALSGSFAYKESAYSYDQKNFLWKVQSRSATVYLLGSIHFLKEDIYPLHKAIENAYESSNNLVVEANINKSASWTSRC